MSGLIMAATNKSDLKLLTDLANRLGVKFKPISNDEILDYGLGLAMLESKKTGFVSREKVMAKLKANAGKVSSKV